MNETVAILSFLSLGFWSIVLKASDKPQVECNFVDSSSASILSNKLGSRSSFR